MVKAVPEFEKRHSRALFEQYYMLFCSRFLGLPKYDPSLSFVVPYADMLNAGNESQANVKWTYDKERHAFKFYAISNIKKGQPVLNFGMFHPRVDYD